MFEDLADQIATSGAAYPLILLIVLGDAVVPVLPGESAIITGGIFAARGDLSVVVVFVMGALGAFTGDNIAYWLGRSAGKKVTEKLFRSEKSQEALAWSRRQLDDRGPTIIVAARFIPGGRTATTFTAGTVRMPWRRFAAADAVGAVLWSGFAATIGYVGGEAFKDSLWKPIVLAIGFALLVGALGEAWRRRTST